MKNNLGYIYVPQSKYYGMQMSLLFWEYWAIEILLLSQRKILGNCRKLETGKKCLTQTFKGIEDQNL